MTRAVRFLLLLVALVFGGSTHFVGAERAPWWIGVWGVVSSTEATAPTGGRYEVSVELARDGSARVWSEGLVMEESRWRGVEGDVVFTWAMPIRLVRSPSGAVAVDEEVEILWPLRRTHAPPVVCEAAGVFAFEGVRIHIRPDGTATWAGGALRWRGFSRGTPPVCEEIHLRGLTDALPFADLGGTFWLTDEGLEQASSSDGQGTGRRWRRVNAEQDDER